MQPEEYTVDGRRAYAQLSVGDATFVGEITHEKSVNVPAWIISDPNISDRAVRLWCYLKGALTRSFSLPGTSHRSLAEVLDVSERSAREAIYELRDAGAIVVQPRYRKGKQLGNFYYLWPAVPAGDENRVAPDCHGGSILPGVLDININNNNAQPESKAKRERREYTEAFDEMWDIYPRRIGKAKAFICFNKLINNGEDAQLLMEAVKAYASERAGKDETYTMHAATFFGPANPWKDYLTGTQADGYEPDGEELTAATIYDIYDRGEGWVDYQSGEPVSRFDNPLKHGYSRPRNPAGQLVDASGKPYMLDAQGKRRYDDWS